MRKFSKKSEILIKLFVIFVAASAGIFFGLPKIYELRLFDFIFKIPPVIKQVEAQTDGSYWTDGQNAFDLLGQFDVDLNPIYTKGGSNDSPNNRGFAYSGIGDVAIDAVNHRLFVADGGNNRVLVYNLDANNNLIDHLADNVLGQPDFYSIAYECSLTSLRHPYGLAYDSSKNRLFVADSGNQRILVFDVTSIENGESAINVLGQPDFTTCTSGLSQNKTNYPVRVDYDITADRLFVSEIDNNRVLVFDVAAIVNGEDAIDVIGQFDINSTPIYTKGGPQDSPNNRGFYYPKYSAIDAVHHRLFVTDGDNHRVLVFNLDVNNNLIDYFADYVLGNPDFYAYTYSCDSMTLYRPAGLAYDSSNDRLFVADSDRNRVLVFDVSTIVNGEPAINVLGQPDFTSCYSGSCVQDQMYRPKDLMYDAVNSRLFVADSERNRVLVFDVSDIEDGEPAINVLGQPDFTTCTSGLSQNKMFYPYGLAYNTANSRLFVADSVNHRVLVFDAAINSIYDGEPADYVLGQPNFTTNSGACAQNKMGGASYSLGPRGLAYDAVNSRLFVSDSSNNRVLIFDVAAIANGEDAINVLGQTSFTTCTGLSTPAQDNLYGPFGLSYDAFNSRLFVADEKNFRILLFDVTAIVDGENAIDVLGQFDINSSPLYTKKGYHNSPSDKGLQKPYSSSIDTVHHRLFVADRENYRVLVYNLDVNNNLIDHLADNVLGQPDLDTNSQTSLLFVSDVDYDSVHNRLFVSAGCRVFVFDVAAIANGEPYVNFLGGTCGISQSQMGLGGAGMGLDYDAVSNRLFVGDQGNYRVLVFDVAAITDGENAVDVLGQFDVNSNPVYTKAGPNDSLNNRGFDNPQYSAIDTVHHRLFVTDGNNNRVLVYNLDFNNNLIDHLADNVLGQPDFYSRNFYLNATTTTSPRGLAYDPVNNRLFVSDPGNVRVLIFDVSTIVNGEPAINVLGPSNFTSVSFGCGKSKLSGPIGLAYDSANSRLFVADASNNRVLVFDVAVASIYDGKPPDYVLGQPDFTTCTSGLSQNKMYSPYGLAYDSANSRLFVSDMRNRRVLVFNMAAIVNGEDAINVLGQTDFVTNTGGCFQDKMGEYLFFGAGEGSRGLSYDAVNNRLFVADYPNDRVLIFDVAAISDGEDAINVLGQPDFNSCGDYGTTPNAASLKSPNSVTYSDVNNLLYVVSPNDGEGDNRIMIFWPSTNVAGWAWDENIGWISFNSNNCDTNKNGKIDSGDSAAPGCPPIGTSVPNYGVNVSPSTGLFSGYAWSENIGWISFSTTDLVGCPSGVACEAKLDFGTNQVSGWARVLAASDGWEGWIKLRGFIDANGNGIKDAGEIDYGVSLNPATQEFEGWAWGGDDSGSEAVVGWISFNCINEGSCADSDYKVYLSLVNPPSAINLSADPANPTDYCGITGYPPVRLRWRFDDPGDTQSYYQIQIAQTSDFSSLAVDTGKVYAASADPNFAFVAQPPYPTLSWGQTYYWRVKVWDSGDVSSDWVTDLSGFTTSPHAYPLVEFSWSPLNPTIDNLVNFTDNSICYDDVSGGGPCGINDSFLWDFSDGNPVSSATQNASTIFSLIGLKIVNLTITDSDAFSCVNTKVFYIRLNRPLWREILPL